MKAALLFLALILAGCNRSDSSFYEVQRLREALQKQEGTRRAELEAMATNAAIAEACDFLVPLCPASVTTPGHDAIRLGITGGASWIFWGAVLAKLAALGALLGAAFGVARLHWLKLGKPARREIEKANNLIDQAEQRAREATREAIRLDHKNEQAQLQLEQLQLQLEQLTQEVDSHKARLDETKTLQAALNAAFD